jgi:hypothetical protein
MSVERVLQPAAFAGESFDTGLAERQYFVAERGRRATLVDELQGDVGYPGDPLDGVSMMVERSSNPYASHSSRTFRGASVKSACACTGANM